MKIYSSIILALFTSTIVSSQPRIVSGPMLGPVELRDAKIWLEVSPVVKTVSIDYNVKGLSAAKSVQYKGVLGNEFNPICFTIGGLQFNTTYEYRVSINGKPALTRGEFTTKDLWQWRKPPPEFYFLTGSCSYFNEPV